MALQNVIAVDNGKVIGINEGIPVDSVTDGDMRPVTSNAVYDAINGLATDSVTDGNMSPVTSNAVADAISGIRESFQDGVDEVYDAVVAKGSTPASHSLSDVVDGIGAIQTGIVPSGTKSITTNGTHDVTNYANANVNVPGIVPSGTKSITTNGTHDVTNYANANVNVPPPFNGLRFYKVYTVNATGSGAKLHVTGYGVENNKLSFTLDQDIPYTSSYSDAYISIQYSSPNWKVTAKKSGYVDGSQISAGKAYSWSYSTSSGVTIIFYI